MLEDQLLFPEFESPGGALRFLLEERGWTQDELAGITGTSRQTIAQILADRSGVTPEMAVALAAAFSTTPTYWLHLDAKHRLSSVKKDPADIERKARVYSVAPVRDMQKRGWIRESRDISEIEEDLKGFFSVSSLSPAPQFPVALRSGSEVRDQLSPAQRAWCFRARQLAMAIPCSRYTADNRKILKLSDELRKLAAYPKEARHTARVFLDYGIRFLVIEPLPGTKLDGAAFWLDEASPVIAVSIRYDRIDNFWFTVMHELSHIRHRDALSVDVDLEDSQLNHASDEQAPLSMQEQRANAEAAAFLIYRSDLDSFVGRVAPLYSRERIIQFAHSIKIHPGIIIGQLQNRGELHSSKNRDLLVRIRDIVTDTALTDGWGKTINIIG